MRLQGFSDRTGRQQRASWNRVLRDGAVGFLIMLMPALLLGFFLSWEIGVAIIAATAGTATLSSLVYSLKGHAWGCSAKKGIVLALGWWARI
ncbi:hypothetical protein ACGFMM_23535 [Streptomyces sp. NPDC048604]|uniref:hypothetical protein n=1 Tax=Streptomyces sp. NPDC048604 TaxID=3365578 RepID=UPI003711F537